MTARVIASPFVRACSHCGLAAASSRTASACAAVPPRASMPSRLRHRHLEPGRTTSASCRRAPTRDLAACNWLAGARRAGVLCLSCRLTRTRPNDADSPASAGFANDRGGQAARPLQLLDGLGLPVRRGRARPSTCCRARRASSPATPTASSPSTSPRPTTRTASARAAARRAVPHRARPPPPRDRPLLLADPRADAGRAATRSARCSATSARTTRDGARPPLRRRGRRPTGRERYVSAYATMHPWEDWAETFAHYLHIRATNADRGRLRHPRHRAAGGQRPRPHGGARPSSTATTPSPRSSSNWLPLTYALNAVNRSMGLEDLYPFILGPKVIAKLSFIHGRVAAL